MRYLFLRARVHYVVLEGSQLSGLVRVLLLLCNAFGEIFFARQDKFLLLFDNNECQESKI